MANSGENIRMAIIDGTGDFSNVSYAANMAHSFCHQLAMQLGNAAYYQRGPSFDGLSVLPRARSAATWLKEQHRQYPSARLMLAGYSRGASSAISAAERLEGDQIDVDALFLFDAVARHIYPGGQIIPANVNYSRYARRSQDAAFVAKYEGSIGRPKLTLGLGAVLGFTTGIGSVSGSALASNLLENPARTSFGNTGLTYRGKGDHLYRYFLGSHGALGGVGWKHVLEDRPCEIEVAAWMNQALREKHVSAELCAIGPF